MKQRANPVQATNWRSYVSNVRSNQYHDCHQLIDEYLEYFCEHNNASLADYYPDFKEHHLE